MFVGSTDELPAPPWSPLEGRNPAHYLEELRA
jgi:hypothetical protein